MRLVPEGNPLPEGCFGERRGPYVEYADNGGCAGCGLAEAKLYFPHVWDGPDDLITPMPPIPGLKIRSREGKIARFSLPGADGVPVLGVASWSGASDYYLAKAYFALPRSQAVLENFLEDRLVQHCSQSVSDGTWGC